jgi:hypothetical protein
VSTGSAKKLAVGLALFAVAVYIGYILWIGTVL